jgi:hypothetical protein
MASPQRLLLHALLSGLGDAVRRNDAAAADRYHRRIRLIAGHFETNPPVSDALERLLSASGQWRRRTWPNALKRSNKCSNSSSLL